MNATVLNVSYGTWKTAATDNGWTVYHDALTASQAIVITGDSRYVLISKVDGADHTDWSTNFGSSTAVASTEDAHALIVTTTDPVPDKVQPVEADLGGTSHWEGDEFDAAAGTSTEHDVAIGASGKLIEGTFWVGPTAVDGDTVDLYIVDVDNILGYGAGTILKHYVATMPVVPSERRRMYSGQSATLLAGLYMRTKYTSTGGNAVRVKIDWTTIV